MNVIAVMTSDYIGLILVVAMLSSSRIRRKGGGLDLRIFSFIGKLTAIACVIDFFAFYFDGMPGTFSKIMNLLCNTFCFVANPLFVFSWCLFVDMKLYRSRSRVKKIYRRSSVPALFLLLMAIINIFYPIIFFLDDKNIYHRLPTSYLYYVIDGVYLTYSVLLIKGYEKKYGKVRFFPIYLMLGPIVTGCAIQSFFYGISLIWVSLAVGLTAIYMSIQNEFSYLDTLTGLYNRAYLDYQMETMARDNTGNLGGIMIDVDYFKHINDTYGHSAGDEALVDVARILLFSKPDRAIAIRFAGDEFILLMKNTTEQNMKRVMDNIKSELDIFNTTEQRQYKLSLSMGYSIYDRECDTMDSFFKHMDENMYIEKSVRHEND